MSITVSGITPGSTHLSGNDIMVKLTTNGFPLNEMDYKLLLKITSPDGVLDGAPFIPAITPNAAGEATFNLSGYVDQYFEKLFTWPIIGLFDGKLIGWVNGSYTLVLYPGESWISKTDGSLEENFGEAFQPVFIVKGKLPKIMLAQLNDAQTTWFDEYCIGGKFFSFMPLVQLITPYQPVKLWWIPPELMNDVNILITHYIGGISDTTVILHGALYYDILWEIECHAVNLGIPLEDEQGNKLEKYTIWIEHNAVEVTEKRTFIIDWNPPHQDYYYLFVENRMGGIETIGLTGRKIFKPSGDRILSKRPFVQDSGILFPTQLSVSAQRKRKWTINSGWKPKEELMALDFLLDAQHAWLALPPSTGSVNIADYTLCPVIITNTELILNDDTKIIESIDIDLEEAY